MTTPAIALPTLTVSEDSRALINMLEEQLSRYQTSNLLKLAYYEGQQRVQQLGISIPPKLRDINVVVGWAGTAVDVIEERLDWFGWRGDEVFGLDEVYSANDLDVESGLAHLDSLIYGTAFAIVGTGGPGEANPLVTVHSPLSTTGLWDERTHRLSSALSVTTDNLGQTDSVTLYLPTETIQIARKSGRWSVEDRDRHNLGRVPVVQFENRARTGVRGRSEITHAVRSLTDQAVRTMLGMEVNREFYSAPQRYAINVAEDAFEGSDGTVRTGWETIMGRVWAVPYDEDNPERPTPQVGQFTPSSPAPYLDQVRGLSQVLAAEAAIPANYLGFQTDNPASADAIRAGEARLVKRSERRQKSFGRGWREVGRLALLVRDGMIPDGFDEVSVAWQDAATPTRAAAADEATKLIAAGVLPADSSVTYDRLGLTPAEQRQVTADKRKSGLQALLQKLPTAQAVQDPAVQAQAEVRTPVAGDGVAG